MFSQNDEDSSKLDLRLWSEHLLLENLRSKYHETRTFLSLISTELAILVFFQSTLRIFACRLCRFPVLIAASCHASSLAGELALYHLSHAWLIITTGTSYFFSSNCAVKISLNVFLLSLGLAKNSTVPNDVFMYAKSNTLVFRFRSGKINQLVKNLDPIQGVWFHEIISNIAVR